MLYDEPRPYRELLRTLESNCCQAHVWEQFYPRKRRVGLNGETDYIMLSFYACNQCDNPCSASRKAKSSLSITGNYEKPSEIRIRTGNLSDADLLAFVAKFRKLRTGILLPETEVADVVTRYCDVTGESRASIRTNQSVCPLSRRTHSNNSIVLRFNLTQKTFCVACWCSPSRSIFNAKLVVQHQQDCRCLTCLEQELTEIYEH